MLRYCFEEDCVRKILDKSKKKDLAVIDTDGIPKSVIQAAVNRLVELFLLHRRHLLDVRNLKIEQAYKREAHYYCYNPNRSFLHNDCKDKRFLNSTYQKC